MEDFFQIHKFAEKWLEKLEQDDMDFFALADECISLGFNADLSEIDDGNISDAMRLGSSIRLMCLNAPETQKEWFRSALSTLEELSSGITNAEAVIILPSYAELKKKAQKLRTELSMLILEHDELVMVECKNIEMAYMLALGGIEYRMIELKNAALRLKRKAELIQAKLNRQEPISIEEIEKKLDKEFDVYTQFLNTEVDKITRALERNKCELLSEEETKELKKLYRSAMKSLHPDLNPDISKEKLALFHNAVEAYENGDLETLRIIETMVSDSPLNEISESGLGALIKECERLSDMIKKVKDDIKKVKNDYPYIMKSVVGDENKMAEKKASIEEKIEYWSNMASYYEGRVNELLGRNI